jgi:methylated-DNA-[protein]-cysteine S-methyltransferase
MQKTPKYTIFKTKWGYFGLVGTKYGLLRTCLLGLEPEKIKPQLLKDLQAAQFDETFFKTTQEQIIAYFESNRVNLSDIPTVLDSASFFVSSVLNACRNIGFGRTICYSGLAKKLGRPAAARAIGNALAKNPLPLVIPCHRVVRSDGKIGGFSAPGGKNLKAKLLKHEHDILTHCKSD